MDRGKDAGNSLQELRYRGGQRGTRPGVGRVSAGGREGIRAGGAVRVQICWRQPSGPVSLTVLARFRAVTDGAV